MSCYPKWWRTLALRLVGVVKVFQRVSLVLAIAVVMHAIVAQSVAPSEALAQAKDDQRMIRVYTISSLMASARANSDVEARQRALDQAKRQAFELLIARLVAPADRDKIQANGRVLESLIRDISFEGERIGGGAYDAQVSVSFWPDQVRQFLERNNIAYEERPRLDVLILPVQCQFGRCLLWERDNFWSRAWTDNLTQRPSAVVGLKVPTDSEVATVSAIAAMEGRRAELETLRAKYNVDGVATVVVTLDSSAEVALEAMLLLSEGAVSQQWRFPQDAATSSNAPLLPWIQTVRLWLEYEIQKSAQRVWSGVSRPIWLQILNLQPNDTPLRVFRLLDSSSLLSDVMIVEQKSNEMLLEATLHASALELRDYLMEWNLNLMRQDQQILQPHNESDTNAYQVIGLENNNQDNQNNQTNGANILQDSSNGLR